MYDVQVECDDGAEGDFSLVYTGPETGLEAEGLEVGLSSILLLLSTNTTTGGQLQLHILT